MLALRAQSDSKALLLEDVPAPEPGPLDVIIKVASAGLAPGIIRLLALNAFPHLPTTLGHEAAGTVARIGSDVAGIAVGARVRIHANLNCGRCDFCRTDRDMMCTQQATIGHAAFGGGEKPLYDEYHDGGLAEYVRVPYWLIDLLPESVSFDVGAKVHDLANAVRALKSGGLPLGSTIVVTAATGAMGAATVKLAKHFGVARLILVGRDAGRLRSVAALAGGVPTDIVALNDLDADWEVSGALARQLKRLAPEGVQAVIDYIPEGPAVGQAMAALATGGTLVHMGSNFSSSEMNPGAFMLNCWRFVGTRACTRNDVREVLRLLESGTLVADELITHRFSLTEALTGVEAMEKRAEPMWMLVVNP